MERDRLLALSAILFAVAATAPSAAVAAAPVPAGSPAAAATSPAPPRPAPSPAELARARALFARARAAAENGRWDDAIEGFEQVRQIKETPAVVFHLAAALEGAGRLARSLAAFERARDLAESGGVADVRALAGGRIASLSERVPRLVVRVPRPEASADVRLDGAPLPPTAWGESIRLDPGAHTVEARVAGSPFVRAIELPEGALITVIVGDAGAPTVSPAPPAEPAPTSSQALPATGLTPEDRAAEAPAAVPVGALIVGGSGVALGVGGLVAFVIAGAENDAAADACADGSRCDPGARDTVRALDGLALGLWIGAVGAVGGAAAWWALDGGASRGAVEARVRPLGADLRARF